MIRRPRRSIPATVLAVVLLAVCVGVVVAVVQSLLGRTPFLSLVQVLNTSGSLRWSDAAVVAAAVVVAVLGLVLLAAALRPGKPTVLPLIRLTGDDGRPIADAGVRRHTLEKDLGTTVSAVSGVASAKVIARRNSVAVDVTTVVGDPDALSGLVRRRLDERVIEIGPAFRPRVRIRARRDRRS